MQTSESVQAIIQSILSYNQLVQLEAAGICLVDKSPFPKPNDPGTRLWDWSDVVAVPRAWAEMAESTICWNVHCHHEAAAMDRIAAMQAEIDIKIDLGGKTETWLIYWNNKLRASAEKETALNKKIAELQSIISDHAEPSTDTPVCHHDGIGLPGCPTCDPRTKSEGGPRSDPSLPS